MAPILPLILIAAVGAYVLMKGKGGGMTTPAGGPIKDLPPEQVKLAVTNALAHETDPAKLNEFADSLLPDYPEYAQALHNRASQLLGVTPVVFIPPPAPHPMPPQPGPAPLPYPYPPPLPQPGPAPLPVTPPPEPVPVPNPPPTPHIDFPNEGSTAYVITHDTGPSGSLNVRSGPSTGASIVTKIGHGTGVTIEGLENNGWVPITTPLGIEGWAATQYLGAHPPADAPGGANGGQELPIGPGGQGNEVPSNA